MADLKELWKVVKLLLALSHGQATVERGFSNKEVMVENLAQHSLAAQRVICDHVRSEGGVLMFSLPRSCCYLQQVEDRHTILPLMRKEEKIKGSEKKRSLLEEISTLKEKRRLETLSGAQHLSCMRRHKIPYQAKKKLISLVCFILFITVSIIVITIIINVVIIFTSNKLVVFIYCMEFLANWMVGTCQQWYSIFINIPKH